jgi:hypothetical protein
MPQLMQRYVILVKCDSNSLFSQISIIRQGEKNTSDQSQYLILNPYLMMDYFFETKLHFLSTAKIAFGK